MALVDAIRAGSDIAFDTDALIYFVETHPAYLPIIEPVVELVYSQQAQGHVSAVNLLEVLVRPLRENRPDLVDKYRSALTTDDRMRLHIVTSEIAERAAGIRAAYRVEVADSIVAATAIEAGCQYLITNNADDFKRIPGIEILTINDYVI